MSCSDATVRLRVTLISTHFAYPQVGSDYQDGHYEIGASLYADIRAAFLQVIERCGLCLHTLKFLERFADVLNLQINIEIVPGYDEPDMSVAG